jgi:hypothetical protein
MRGMSLANSEDILQRIRNATEFYTSIAMGFAIAKEVYAITGEGFYGTLSRNSYARCTRHSQMRGSLLLDPVSLG